MILSTDYNDFYPYSRYVNVELIDKKDSICAKQKVLVSQDGYFYATIPTADIHYRGMYFLRAYTKFMRNQPEVTFPMNRVSLTSGAKLMYESKTNSASQVSHMITVRDSQNKLQIDVLNAFEPMELYCFQSGFGLIKLQVQAGKTIAFDTSQIPDGLLTFWLRSGNRTLDEISVWVGDIQNRKVSLSELGNSGVKPIVIKRIVDDNSHTLHAFESLNIMQHVHSDKPFPETFYRVPSDSAKILLNNWLATAHFIGFDLQKAIDSSFEYPFTPERSLSIEGTAQTKRKKQIEKGTVEILNVSTLDSHICAMDSLGYFEQAVADFEEGNRFFIEAKNGKGDGSKNMVTWNEEESPKVENLLPRLQYSTKTTPSNFIYEPVHADKNSVDLDELVVKATRENKEDKRQSKLIGVYMFDRNELQRKYGTVKRVLEHSGMIDFKNEDTFHFDEITEDWPWNSNSYINVTGTVDAKLQSTTIYVTRYVQLVE